MPGVHDSRDTGGMVEPYDLPGHEVTIIGEPVYRLIGKLRLFREIHAAAASVSQRAHEHCCQHGRVQRVAHRITHGEMQGIPLDAEIERVSADIACWLQPSGQRELAPLAGVRRGQESMLELCLQRKRH